VSSILNFAPTVLVVPDEVEVRKVDMSIELQILAFHEQRKVSSPQQVARRLNEVLPDERRVVSS
jgi:redox-sensing transcriptional repressor